jgi:hypothetical protein
VPERESDRLRAIQQTRLRGAAVVTMDRRLNPCLRFNHDPRSAIGNQLAETQLQPDVFTFDQLLDRLDTGGRRG